MFGSVGEAAIQREQGVGERSKEKYLQQRDEQELFELEVHGEIRKAVSRLRPAGPPPIQTTS